MVIEVAFIILTITANVTESFVMSLAESDTLILKLYVPASVQSVVAIEMFDVGAHESQGAQAPVATLTT